MPDGISTAPEVRSLIAQERAIWVALQFATLVALVSRHTGVPVSTLIGGTCSQVSAEQDARRIGIMLTPEWLRGIWTNQDLARLWGVRRNNMGYYIRRHAELMKVDPLYRELTVKLRAALEAERPSRGAGQ